MKQELTVTWWPTEKPIPYARNARVCPESATAKVAVVDEVLARSADL